MCLAQIKQQQIILGSILVFILTASIPWLQSALNYFSCILFWFIRWFPNILFLPPSKRTVIHLYIVTSFCIHLQTWPCT
jgi:hypothetical protein